MCVCAHVCEREVIDGGRRAEKQVSVVQAPDDRLLQANVRQETLEFNTAPF